MSIEQIVQSEIVSTPMHVECNKISKVCIQQLWYLVPALDIQLKKFENNNPVCKKIGCRLQNTTSNIPFFGHLIWTYGLAVEVSSRESGVLGLISTGCWNPVQPLGHFAWHWASQCTDMRAFILLLLSLNFIFLDFVSGNLVLTELQILTWPSDFHCFGEIKLLPGPTLAHMCCLAHGQRL